MKETRALLEAREYRDRRLEQRKPYDRRLALWLLGLLASAAWFGFCVVRLNGGAADPESLSWSFAGDTIALAFIALCWVALVAVCSVLDWRGEVKDVKEAEEHYQEMLFKAVLAGEQPEGQKKEPKGGQN